MSLLAPGDGDDAAHAQDLEEERDVPRPPPGMTLVALGARVVAQVAREHRPVPLELAQHVAPEGGVRAQELRRVPLRRRRSRAAAAHASPEQRQRLDRPDEGVPLEQLSLLPEEAVELRDVVRAESAPEHELLRRSDGRDRVDLEVAEPPDRVEHGRRRAVEELGAHGDPARVLGGDDPHSGASGSSRQRSSGAPGDSIGTRSAAVSRSSQLA